MSYEDLTGRVYGFLTVVNFAYSAKGGRWWNCRCVCGKNTIVNSSRLGSGNSKSCGCAGGKINLSSLIGKRFGKLQVLADYPPLKQKSRYICVCDCGVFCVKYAKYLKNGDTVSCGCKLYAGHPSMCVKNAKDKIIDISGRVYGYLQVLCITDRRKTRPFVYECLDTRTGEIVYRNSSTINKTGDYREYLRKAILRCFTNYKQHKRKKTHMLLGASIETVFKYLGEYPGADYHLDHICPVKQAQNIEEFEKLQHYTNLRWLYYADNIRKRDSKTEEGEEMCRKLLNREWVDDPVFIQGSNPCLSGETLIQTIEGLVKIKDLVGKKAIIYDGYEFVENSSFRVTGENKELFRITFTNGEYVDATEYHKFISYKGRKHVKNLKKGDKLLTKWVNTYWTIESIDSIGMAEKVYCCTVPSTNTFLLGNGLWSGNCGEISLKNRRFRL